MLSLMKVVLFKNGLLFILFDSSINMIVIRRLRECSGLVLALAAGSHCFRCMFGANWGE